MGSANEEDDELCICKCKSEKVVDVAAVGLRVVIRANGKRAQHPASWA